MDVQAHADSLEARLESLGQARLQWNEAVASHGRNPVGLFHPDVLRAQGGLAKQIAGGMVDLLRLTPHIGEMYHSYIERKQEGQM